MSKWDTFQQPVLSVLDHTRHKAHAHTRPLAPGPTCQLHSIMRCIWCDRIMFGPDPIAGGTLENIRGDVHWLGHYMKRSYVSVFRVGQLTLNLVTLMLDMHRKPYNVLFNPKMHFQHHEGWRLHHEGFSILSVAAHPDSQLSQSKLAPFLNFLCTMYLVSKHLILYMVWEAGLLHTSLCRLVH